MLRSHAKEPLQRGEQAAVLKRKAMKLRQGGALDGAMCDMTRVVDAPKKNVKLSQSATVVRFAFGSSVRLGAC